MRRKDEKPYVPVSNYTMFNTLKQLPFLFNIYLFNGSQVNNQNRSTTITIIVTSAISEQPGGDKKQLGVSGRGICTNVPVKRACFVSFYCTRVFVLLIQVFCQSTIKTKAKVTFLPDFFAKES